MGTWLITMSIPLRSTFKLMQRFLSHLQSHPKGKLDHHLLQYTKARSLTVWDLTNCQKRLLFNSETKTRLLPKMISDKEFEIWIDLNSTRVGTFQALKRSSPNAQCNYRICRQKMKSCQHSTLKTISRSNWTYKSTLNPEVLPWHVQILLKLYSNLFSNNL